MPRSARYAPAGLVYHVLNRAVARLTLFKKAADFEAFERVLSEAHSKVPLAILSFCVMPNHWHFVVWPQEENQLTEFFRWLTHTHTMRWHANHQTSGTGHLYQARFKSFPVQTDSHLLGVLRYVERNPRRANLVEQAARWRWGSLWHRLDCHSSLRGLLSEWPVPMPHDWAAWVDEPQTDAELEAIRRSVSKGTPLGCKQWVAQTVARLGLESTTRPRGRPRKHLA